MIGLLADALHQTEVFDEPSCYCRRIATADGTLDGPLNPSPSAGYTEDWGFTEPACEELAATIYAALAERGVKLVTVGSAMEDS